MKKINLLILVAVLGLGVWSANAQSEDEWIAVLKSGAGLKEKMDACVMLGRVGTEQCVPALAALLGDPELSHMARYALEPIPGPAVDAALRDALGKLKGRELVGVIGSVGVRKDTAATAALAGYLNSKDTMVVEAAARALGSLETKAAAVDLQRALNKVPAGSRWAVAEGIFRCAESFVEEGEKKQAMALYDDLRAQKDLPHQVRTGALRGAVLTRGAKKGLPLLLEALHSRDSLLFGAACRTAMELPGKSVSPALAAELDQLSTDEQVVLTSVLGRRGDKQALPALLKLAQNGLTPARVAAIRAVSELNDATATGALLKLWKDTDAEVAAAAELALAAQQGAKADAAIAAMLKSDDVSVQCAAIELLGLRRSTGAMPALLNTAKTGDKAAAGASLRVLGELAGMDELPALINIIVSAEDPAIRKAAESAASTVCQRLAQPKAGSVVITKALYGDLPDGKKKDVTKKVAAIVEKGSLTIKADNKALGGDPAKGTPKRMRVDYTVDGVAFSQTVREKQSVEIKAVAKAPAEVEDMLCAALDNASVEAKMALMRVMRFGGADKAFAIVKTTATSGSGKVKDEAVSILSGWSDPAAFPTLLKMAQTTKDKRTKILALRGCCRLLPAYDVPAKQKLKLFNEIMGMAERADEKKLALSALGSIETVEALKAAQSYLKTPDFKEEASLATVQIGNKLPAKYRAEIEAAMKAAQKASKNKETKKSAKRVLNKYVVRK